MDLTKPEDLRTALKLAGIYPKKGLGQHFLVDRASLELIVAAGELLPTDVVLEIGPGLGVLTRPLTAAAGSVVAVEMDPILAELLSRAELPHLSIAQADIMHYDLSSLPSGYKVVANIPYYVTSGIIRLLLEAANPPSRSVLLIQREVAERVTARPGQLSVLALSVQYYADARIAGIVERHKFWPAPNVDSAILVMDRRPAPQFPADRTKLFRLIKAGFGEKRKQLKNALSGGLNVSAELAVQLLETAQIDVSLRAQALDWPAWERLYVAALAKGLL